MNKPLLKPANAIPLEKLAYSTQLGKDAEEWPMSIIKEAYKQVPYLRNYEVDVKFDRTDESRGYGVGKMLVYPNKMEKNAAIESNRIVSFPLIVRGHEVSPLDVVSFKGEIRPASESFVSEKLFRPEIFQGAAKPGQFKGSDLASQIDPPVQRVGGMSKSAHVNILDAVLLNASNAQINQVKEDLRKTAGLVHASKINPSFRQGITRIILTKEKTASDIRNLRQSTILPSVTQWSKKGIKYFVKAANHNSYNPHESEITRFTAQKHLSFEEFQELCKVGHVTIVSDPIEQETVLIKTAGWIDRIGAYESLEGKKDVVGIAIPRMVSLEGDRLYTKLFITKTASAFQGDMSGRFIKDVDLPNEVPRGKGVFVYQDGNKGFATEILRIQNDVSMNKGKEKVAFCIAKRSSGEAIKITKMDGLLKIASMGNGSFAIPSSMKWIPLPDKSMKITSSPYEYEQTALQKRAASMQLISDGNVFQMRGSNIFEGLMERNEADFALAAYGIGDAHREEIIKTAAAKGEANIYNHRQIYREEDILKATMSKIAKSRIDVSSIQKDLIKEASVIVDKETVDSILALKFLTPENVGTYIQYIPELEKTAQKLAEILVASRLGMDDIKEVAAKNAMTQMSSVLEGLHGLQSKVM